MMHTILHSVLLLVATLSFFWAFGFAFLQALFRYDDFEECLVLSPLIGIGVILFIVGSLWCLDLKIQYIVYSLPCTLLLLGVVSLMRKKNSLNERIESKDRKGIRLFLLALLLTAIIQGFSYFVLGPSLYIGFGTRDMWNYTAIAQTIVDLPYSVSLHDGNQNPLLPIYDFFKDSRPGSSVLLAIISILFKHTTKEVWGVVSLLGPILLTGPLWLIGRELNIRPYYRFLAVTIGTSLPGIAWVHLENTFLGHALALPFVIVWPFLIQRQLVRADVKSFILTAVIFFTCAFVYSEMLTLLVVLAILLTGWDFVRSYSINSIKKSLLKLFSVIGSMVIGFLMIPTAKSETLRLLYVSPLYSMDPWPIDGLTIPGLIRIWSFNPNWVAMNEKLIFLVTLFTLLVILISFTGVVLSFLQKRSPLCLALLALLCLPIVLASFPQQHQHIYQYYKTLVTFSPILPFGLVYICQNLAFESAFETRAIRATLILVAMVSFSLAAYTTYSSGKALLTADRQFRDPVFLQLSKELEQLKDKNILIIDDDYFFDGWFAYYGRQNKLWFTTDPYDAAGWQKCKNGKHMRFNDLDFLPTSNFEIAQRSTLFTPQTPQLQKNVAIIAENISTAEKDAKRLLLTNHLSLKIISNDNCTIVLSGLALPQQLSNSASLKIRVGNKDLGWKIIDVSGPTKINYAVSIKSGVNDVSIDMIPTKNISVSTSHIVFSNLGYLRAST